jgi:hypothetical protein
MVPCYALLWYHPFLFKKEEGFMAEQEDFASMLDDYIDPEEIREIVEEDLKEEKAEKQHRSGHSTEAKFPEEMTISIQDFVKCFLNIQVIPKVEIIEEKKYRKGKKAKVVKSRKITTRVNYDTLWHQGLKELGSPFLFGVDNEYANKNPDRVYDGELLLVIDAKGNRGTYVNPTFLRQLIESEDIEKELKKLRKTGVQQLEELEEYIEACAELQLKVDTLAAKNKKLLQLLKETHKMKKYKELKKEIKHNVKL